MSIAMFFIVIVFEITGALPFTLCSICLVLLLCETAFGICLGCKIYPLFFKNEERVCPGNYCSIFERMDFQKVKPYHFMILAVFAAVMFTVVTSFIVK